MTMDFAACWADKVPMSPPTALQPARQLYTKKISPSCCLPFARVVPLLPLPKKRPNRIPLRRLALVLL